jgi:hypothetical protein
MGIRIVEDGADDGGAALAAEGNKIHFQEPGDLKGIHR